MRGKILKQTGFCLLLAAALLISKNSGVGPLEKGAETVLAQMEVHYSGEDLKKGAEKGIGLVSSLPGKVDSVVSVMTGKATYGEPIDQEYDGNQTAVYAVGAGQVTAVGENEEIGRYIKITHASEGESLYGNLETVYVQVPDKVRKGQAIAVYKKSDMAEFYYSFREFN